MITSNDIFYKVQAAGVGMQFYKGFRSKGQEISEWNFGVLQFFKKPTKNLEEFLPWFSCKWGTPLYVQGVSKWNGRN